MKKIQKLLITSLMISASLSAAVPIPRNLNLSKNTGSEVTQFINKYITLQRPTVKTLGVLEADFDISDIETVWKLKQAIDSKKVVVSKKKRKRWNETIKSNYGKFINIDALTSEKQVKDLQLAFYNLNHFMDRYIESDDTLTHDLNASILFKKVLGEFLFEGGQPEPFQEQLDNAERTIREDAITKKAVVTADNTKELDKMKTAFQSAERQLRDKKISSSPSIKTKSGRSKARNRRLDITRLSKKVKILKENARNFCKKHHLSIPDWAQIDLPEIKMGAFSKALIEIAKRDPSTVVTTDELEDELGVD